MRLHTALTLQVGPLRVHIHTCLRGEWTSGWWQADLPTNAHTKAFAALVKEVRFGPGYYQATERWEERPAKPLKYFSSEPVELAASAAWAAAR